MADIDTRLVDQFVDEHYDALKRIARAKRRSMPAGQTLLTTDLLHETWLKLRLKTEWENEAHFFRTAALAMRQVIVDSARRRLRDKRGGGTQMEHYDEWQDEIPDFNETPEQIVAIDDLLQRLDTESAGLTDIVNLRYFAGFTEMEAAKVLGVTDRTIRRKWALAKAWLAAELDEAD